MDGMTQKQISETYQVNRKTVQRWQDAASEVLGIAFTTPYTAEHAKVMHHIGRCCSEQWKEYASHTGLTERQTPKQCCAALLEKHRQQSTPTPASTEPDVFEKIETVEEADVDDVLAAEDSFKDAIAAGTDQLRQDAMNRAQGVMADLQRVAQMEAALMDPSVQRQLYQRLFLEQRALRASNSPQQTQQLRSAAPTALPDSLTRIVD